MALTELLSIVTLLSVILTAVVFVKEKEDGTWDIMLLMPVNAKIIILAKSFSQVIIVMVGIVISVGFVIFGVFDTPINGSFFAFMLLSFLYAFTGAGIGLFIAAYASECKNYHFSEVLFASDYRHGRLCYLCRVCYLWCV